MWPCPLQGRFLICRLGLATFNTHTKFEVSMVIRFEDMKGNAKCRNCGGLGGYGSLKVIGNVAIRQSTYDFLVDFNRNYASIFYRLMPMTHDRQKSADTVGRQSRPTKISRLLLSHDGLLRPILGQLFISTKWPIHLTMKHSYQSTRHKRAYNKATSHEVLSARRSHGSGTEKQRSTRTA